MRHLRYVALLGAVLLITGCSSNTPTTTTAGSSATPETSNTSTAPPTTTTTTEPEPELAPTGAVWVDTPVIPDRAGLFTRAVRDIDGTRWIVGSEYNTMFLARSTDGETWEEIRLEEPDAHARSAIEILSAPGGRLVVIGNRGTDCQTSATIEGGFRSVGICRSGFGTVHLSDDGGDTWRRVEPPALSPSGRAQYSFASAVATPDGVTIAYTVRDQDWHTLLVTSPDGETWTRAARLDGVSGPLSAVSLHHDGEAYVLFAHEHPCPAINYNAPGWILGANWLEHGRFFEGTSPDALTLHSAASLPGAADPAEIDCATFDHFDNDLDYPTWTVGMADGAITVVDITADDDQPRDTYPVARRVNGTWTSTEITAQTAATGSAPVSADALTVVDHPLGAALVEVLDLGTWGQNGYRLGITPIDDPEAAVVSESIFDYPRFVGWAVDGDAMELASFVSGARGAAMNLLHSEPSEPGVATCTPAPGANCLGARLRDVVADGELRGADLRGIRLRFADLAGVDFTGADLTGADLRNTRGAIRWEGADITNAIFTRADLEVEGWPHTVTGAAIDNSLFEVSWPDDAGDDWTVSLAGIRLLSAGKIRGGERLLPISSLVGAEINSGDLERVDLTGTDLGDLDLTWVRFDEESICPDGSAPFERSFGLRCDP